MVLLALTVVVSSLTVVPGRATPLQGGVHLVLFAAYLELAINPGTRRPARPRPHGHRPGLRQQRETAQAEQGDPRQIGAHTPGDRARRSASAVATIGVSAPPRTPPRL